MIVPGTWLYPVRWEMLSGSRTWEITSLRGPQIKGGSGNEARKLSDRLILIRSGLWPHSTRGTQGHLAFVVSSAGAQSLHFGVRPHTAVEEGGLLYWAGVGVARWPVGTVFRHHFRTPKLSARKRDHAVTHANLAQCLKSLPMYPSWIYGARKTYEWRGVAL